MSSNDLLPRQFYRPHFTSTLNVKVVKCTISSHKRLLNCFCCPISLLLFNASRSVINAHCSGRINLNIWQKTVSSLAKYLSFVETGSTNKTENVCAVKYLRVH
jgi:hypothetical protein